MKLLPVLACLALALAPLRAAPPVVTIAESGAVLVDGVDFGRPADTIANNPHLASPIQRALDAHLAARAAERDAAVAAQAAAEAKVAAVVAKAEAALADPAKAAELSAEVTAAKQSEKERRIAKIEEQKAKLEAEKVQIEAAAEAVAAEPVKGAK